MRYFLLMIAVVALVGCGKAKEERADKAKEAAEAKAAVEAKAAADAKVIEKAIRIAAKKLTGELTKADLEKVTGLNLQYNQLTDVKGLEKLTQLTSLVLSYNKLTEVPKGLEKLTKLRHLILNNNQLTDLKGLEKLTQLTSLNLINNPDLTKAQIDQLQKALPKCQIQHNAKK